MASTLRLAAALLFLPLALAAQSITIPLDDPVYRDLDRLIAAGLVESPMVGQRPFSRNEVKRMLASALSRREGRSVTAATSRALERVRLRFASTPAAETRARVDLLGLSSPTREIPADSLGTVDALVNPLLDRDAGREMYNGGTVALELHRDWLLGSRAALRVRPRGIVGMHAGETMARGSVQALSATVWLRNLVLEVGRQPVLWGVGMDGGLLLSGSSRPLDAIRGSTERPFRIPYVSDVTGPMRGSVLVADLGKRQNFPHAQIVGYKLTVLPRPWFEMSAQVLAQIGGRGAPKTGFGEYLKDLIPPLKYILPDDTTQFSNKFAGWEFRFRFPDARGLELYTETALDDADPRRWKSSFWEDAGHVAGVSLGEIGVDGAVSAALELQHTGRRFFQHSVFRSGWAFDRTLVGAPIGNDANGALLRVRWDRASGYDLDVDAGLDRRSGDVVNTQSDADFANFRFVVVHRHPSEWRGRVVLTASTPDAAWRRSWRVGVEQVRNYAFGTGASRYNFLIGGSVDVRR